MKLSQFVGNLLRPESKSSKLEDFTKQNDALISEARHLLGKPTVDADEVRLKEIATELKDRQRQLTTLAIALEMT